QYHLGAYYLTRQPPDTAAGQKWLAAAAAQGHALAKTVLENSGRRVVDGKINLAEVLDAALPAMRPKITGLRDPALACYKQDRESMAAAAARGFDACKSRLVRTHGEWVPVADEAPIGREFGLCINTGILGEKNLSPDQLLACFRTSGLR